MYRRVLPLLLTAVLLLSGCTAGQKNIPQKTDEKERTGQPSDMSGEGSMYMDTTENVIYLAGGCFWGMEQLMQSIPGVIDAESGYANGTCEADADYKTVCKGETGFRETVRVEYDPGQVSLDALLLAYVGPVLASGLFVIAFAAAVLIEGWILVRRLASRRGAHTPRHGGT